MIFIAEVPEVLAASIVAGEKEYLLSAHRACRDEVGEGLKIAVPGKLLIMFEYMTEVDEAFGPEAVGAKKMPGDWFTQRVLLRRRVCSLEKKALK